MKLKFLVDVCVGKKVEVFLSGKGFDTKCVRAINPKMPDIEILKIAFQDKRVVITMDKDFGELIYNSKMAHSGIILLRLEDASGEEKVKILSNILENYYEKINNSFLIFQNGKLRIKKGFLL